MLKNITFFLMQIFGWMLFWFAFALFVFFKFYETVLSFICEMLDAIGIWLENYLIKQIWRKNND